MDGNTGCGEHVERSSTWLALMGDPQSLTQQPRPRRPGLSDHTRPQGPGKRARPAELIGALRLQGIPTPSQPGGQGRVDASHLPITESSRAWRPTERRSRPKTTQRVRGSRQSRRAGWAGGSVHSCGLSVRVGGSAHPSCVNENQLLPAAVPPPSHHRALSQPLSITPHPRTASLSRSFWTRALARHHGHAAPGSREACGHPNIQAALRLPVLVWRPRSCWEGRDARARRGAAKPP